MSYEPTALERLKQIENDLKTIKATLLTILQQQEIYNSTIAALADQMLRQVKE